jgi:hypothetical protein
MIVQHAGDERSIEFDDMNREVAQMRERGTTRSEIVERDANASGPQTLQRSRDVF